MAASDQPASEVLEVLSGRTYGPFTFRISASKVAEYVQSTGDQPDRWTEYAPPSYAGAVLFQAAPAFLGDPDVASHSRLLIHGEQTFQWPAPWKIGSQITARGKVERIRERAGVMFATFVMEAQDESGQTVLYSRSVFLMSAASLPGTSSEPRPAPPPEARRRTAPPERHLLPAAGQDYPPLFKSASRADLIRYAAAAQDFNPVHWDHQTGVDLGVGGTICHGLLLAAWAGQPVVASVHRPDPLAEARFRFRLPLPPDEQAQVTTTVTDLTPEMVSARSAVTSAAGENATAVLKLRRAE